MVAIEVRSIELWRLIEDGGLDLVRKKEEDGGGLDLGLWVVARMESKRPWLWVRPRGDGWS